ncbi:hypothetical protein [Enterococcus durans]|uniref:Uncharacterized protein n=1 Tax=Enterococcus durans TaxID=53345 RepID=A0A377KHV1_9ENTE|nr:hypothetical protein [Enterococcus durans]STP28739.1 Uncharacterised protein [Enterococcus durans]
MSELKPKICMMPGCDKETFDKKAFFCGEHEREFKAFLSTTVKAASVAVGAAVMFVAKTMTGKKK